MTASYKGLTVPEYTDAADGPQAFRSLVDSGPVPRFASASARDAAYPSPPAGVLVYNAGVPELQIYNGSVWKSLQSDYAALNHKHNGADITSGTISQARLPWATISVGGKVRLKNSVTSAAVDNWAATPNSVKAAYDKAVAAFNNAATALSVAGHSHPYVKTSGNSTITGILTVTDEIRVSEGSATDPSFVLTESTNDTGFYGADSLGRVGVTIDGGVGNYVFAKSGFVSLVSGKNLGADAYPFKNLYLTGSIQSSSLNGYAVEELVALVNSLASEAQARGASVNSVLTRRSVE